MNITISATMYVICSTRKNENKELRYVPVVAISPEKQHVGVAASNNMLDLQHKYTKLLTRMCYGGFEPMIVPMNIAQYKELINTLNDNRVEIMAAYKDLSKGYKLIMNALGEPVDDETLSDELINSSLNAITSNSCCALSPDGRIVKNENYQPLGGIMEMLSAAADDNDLDGFMWGDDEWDDED